MSIIDGDLWWTHKEKIKFIVDKNPRYTLFTVKLKSIFKEGKFIRIMRDPRDNITSHVRFTGKRVGYLSYKWLSYNLIIDKYSKLENDRFLTLSFEDLILDKMTFFKKFGNFIEKKGVLWFTITGIFIVILAVALYIIFK